MKRHRYVRYHSFIISVKNRDTENKTPPSEICEPYDYGAKKMRGKVGIPLSLLIVIEEKLILVEVCFSLCCPDTIFCRWNIVATIVLLRIPRWSSVECNVVLVAGESVVYIYGMCYRPIGVVEKKISG